MATISPVSLLTDQPQYEWDSSASVDGSDGAYKDGDHTNKIMRYPQDIISATTDYIKIESVKHTAEAEGRSGFGAVDSDDFMEENGSRVKELSRTLHKSKVDTTTILPIPQNIQDNQSTGWGRNEINDWAAWGVSKFNKIAKTDSIGDAWTKTTDMVGDAFGAAGTTHGTGSINFLKARLIAGAANVFGSNVTAQGLLARSTGQIINTNVELLFNSVTMRSFTFGWDLVPRDGTEAKEIAQIIRNFKKRSSAKKNPDKNFGFLNAPDLWRISYMKGGGKHPYLNAFKHCALANVSTNYTGSGTYSTYDDGTPVHMKLSATFQELNPIYAEDYEEAGAGTGVGY